jgi:Fe-S-cluster-containing dehydrogenase component
VGCHACAIACINEHQLAPGTFWRQIVTFNPARVPGLPTWHLSLACNHCLDAPCLRHCPARAIARHERTGAVVIDEGRCIGCRYCSWVCPYDAPRFDVSRGVMEKCTFCTHRLVLGLGPACASQCPTGALAVGPFDGEGTTVRGFPQADIRPAIRFVSRRGVKKAPADDTAPGESPRVGGGTAGSGDVQGGDAASARLAGAAGLPGFDDGVIPVPASKISLRHEWSLVAFTFVAVVSVAWVSGSLIGGPRVRLAPLLAMGAAAMASSASHLGRPHRAWRALLNWRRSWLSREVIAWPTFLGVAAIWLTAGAGSIGPCLVAALAGLACLACVDRVYAVMARAHRAVFDDAAAVSAAVFLAGVLAGVWFLALAAGAYRLAAFVQRRGARDRGVPVSWWRHPVLRVGVGLLLPAALWMATPSWWWPACVSCAFLGEALDRADFYASLDVETPARAMARAFVALL